MNLYYYLKMQSRLVLKGAFYFFIIMLGSNLLLQDFTTWKLLKYSLILIPLFFTANALSEEIEQRIDGILFTARKPIYQQMFYKYFSGWLFSQGMVFLIYLSAHIVGLENSMQNWFVLIIYSTYLSLIGFTAANLSKNSLIGYGIPLGYWMVQMAGGFRFNESVMPFSVILNLEITNTLLWSNLLSILGLSCVLAWLNLWYLSKGEGLRKNLAKYTVICVLLVLLIGGGIFTYVKEYQTTLQSKVFNGKKGEVLYVLDTFNPEVEEFVDQRQANWIRADQIKATDWVNYHLVWISDSGATFGNNLKRQVELISQLQVTTDGVKYNNICIQGSTGLRLLTLNPFNQSKYLVYFEAVRWTSAQLEVLFGEKYGNLLITNEKEWLARYNYRVEQSYLDVNRFNLKDQVWFTMSTEHLRVDYIGVSETFVQQLLDINEVLRRVIMTEFGLDIPYPVIQVYLNKGVGQTNPEVLQLGISSRRELQTVEEGGTDWIEKIVMKNMGKILENVNNPVLSQAWSQYILKTRIIPGIQKELYLKDWLSGYNLERYHNEKRYLNQIALTLEPEHNFKYYELPFVAASLLYLFDQSGLSFFDLIRRIDNYQQPLGEEELSSLLGDFLSKTQIDQFFTAFHQAQQVAEEYRTSRWVRRDDE